MSVFMWVSINCEHLYADFADKLKSVQQCPTVDSHNKHNLFDKCPIWVRFSLHCGIPDKMD